MIAQPPEDSAPAGDTAGQFDVVIIGAGLIGLSSAMALLGTRPSLRVAVLEKEPGVGAHQSGHNSGVIHAGLYYQPGSLKARFCREGRQAMTEFADAHQIPYRLTGKLVVATDDSELGRLGALAERGRANGLAVSELGPAEFAGIEPAVRGIRALHIPESGVIDYRKVAAAYAKVVTSREGGMILTRSAELEREARIYRDQGKASSASNQHVRPGYDWRRDESSAGTGRVHLRRLGEFIGRRRAVAARYEPDRTFFSSALRMLAARL